MRSELSASVVTIAAAIVLSTAGSRAAGFAEAIAQDAPASAPESAPEATCVNPPFGEAGNWMWSLGGAIAFGGKDSDGAYQGFVSFDTFLAKDFQIGLELGGWFFDQEDAQDALGGSVILDVRWHFLPWEASKEEWSLFAELGIGVAGMSADVPPGTGEFNFTPRAGVGATFRLGDGQERLLVGARWQHFSNARIHGGDRNDASDNVMLYAGVVFPF